ncbi:hypothetical protein BTHER_10249 [Brochothrix thermosphacta DSM 20171 = FSL F6-1036]|nr:hypothetical protein BTHER_10249 [Brochothrix thermosphacta DSM 20171 = FSL F6-1036]
MATAQKTTKIKQEVTQEKKSLTYKEQLEWDVIEDKMLALDEEVSALREQLEAVGADYTKAQQLSEQIDAKEAESEKTMERWEYLSQYAKG